MVLAWAVCSACVTYILSRLSFMLPKSLLSALLGACSFKPGKLQRHQKHNHLNIFLVSTVGVMTEKKKDVFAFSGTHWWRK